LVFDVATGKELCRIDYPVKTRNGYTDYGPTAIGANDTEVASKLMHPKVDFWNLTTGKKITTIDTNHTAPIVQMKYCPSGTTFATSGYDGTVEFFDVKTRKHVRTLRGQSGTVGILEFSNDGKNLFSCGSNDKAIFIWDVLSGMLVRKITHPCSIQFIALHPNRRELATVGADSRLRILDLRTGKAVHDTKAPRRIFELKYSPDGKLLAFGNEICNVKLLDATNLTEVGTLE